MFSPLCLSPADLTELLVVPIGAGVETGKALASFDLWFRFDCLSIFFSLCFKIAEVRSESNIPSSNRPPLLIPKDHRHPFHLRNPSDGSALFHLISPEDNPLISLGVIVKYVLQDALQLFGLPICIGLFDPRKIPDPDQTLVPLRKKVNQPLHLPASRVSRSRTLALSDK
jgi:hypothetical protein